MHLHFVCWDAMILMVQTALGEVPSSLTVCSGVTLVSVGVRRHFLIVVMSAFSSFSVCPDVFCDKPILAMMLWRHRRRAKKIKNKRADRDIAFAQKSRDSQRRNHLRPRAIFSPPSCWPRSRSSGSRQMSPDKGVFCSMTFHLLPVSRTVCLRLATWTPADLTASVLYRTIRTTCSRSPRVLCWSMASRSLEVFQTSRLCFASFVVVWQARLVSFALVAVHSGTPVCVAGCGKTFVFSDNTSCANTVNDCQPMHWIVIELWLRKAKKPLNRKFRRRASSVVQLTLPLTKFESNQRCCVFFRISRLRSSRSCQATRDLAPSDCCSAIQPPTNLHLLRNFPVGRWLVSVYSRTAVWSELIKPHWREQNCPTKGSCVPL